ncbi:hypothetical protein RQP46_009749 [Phenoliferia psychrophenolica]
MESGTASEPGDLTAQGVKKQLLALEKAINKNRDLRTRYGNDPEKFVDSEFALIEALHALLLLSSQPTMAFPLLLELSTHNSIADLLSHENTDVVVAVIEVLEEWTDEEVLEADEDEEDEATDARRDAMKGLVEGLVEAGVVELVVSGIERFNEEDETERGGLFHSLGMIENLISLLPSIATSLLRPKSGLLAFLLKRVGQDKLPADRDQNRFYAGEILSILLGLSVDGIKEGRERLATEDAVDGLLRVLSVYRRRDPTSADEAEFMENIFDTLCSALSEPKVKTAFLEGEGTELMCLMLKEKKLSRTRAIKTLDFAMQGQAGIPTCEKFVEMLGLKTLFSAFMGKGVSKSKRAEPTTREDTEHILSVIASLLTSLASDSPSRLRLLSKFVEGDYEKVDRLVELREEIEGRISAATSVTDPDLDEDEIYLEKLDYGLFSLQLVDYAIAWLCMEDDGVRDHIKMLLSRKDKSLDDVIRVLTEYRNNLGDTGDEAPPAVEEEGADIQVGEPLAEGDEQRVILEALIEYLVGLDAH